MDLTELARRAVACKGWRWMPGMLTTAGRQVVSKPFDKLLLNNTLAPAVWVADPDRQMRLALVEGLLPDFSDDATTLLVLPLVREAWSCPTVCVVHEGSGHPDPWAVRARRGEALGIGVIEAEALVLALEAAS